MTYRRIAVLMGGWSPERKISLLSGANVASTLRSAGFEVTEIDVPKNLWAITKALYEANPDYIINALHGIEVEDGVIQGVLELFGKPYSGSGVLSSAVCFNKLICKLVALQYGLKTPKFLHIHSLDNISFDYPYVIKPVSNGSSIGVFVVNNQDELLDIKNNKWSFGNDILVEEYIPGREFTVCVSEGKAIGTIEISLNRQYYDYETKYKMGNSIHNMNCNLDEKQRATMFKAAETIFKACNCSTFARIDFRFDDKDFYFLEVNTQPGFSAQSLVPDLLRSMNMNIVDLLKLK